MLTSIFTISSGAEARGKGCKVVFPTENVTSRRASNVLLQHIYRSTPNNYKTSAERKVEWAISREDTKFQESLRLRSAWIWIKIRAASALHII